MNGMYKLHKLYIKSNSNTGLEGATFYAAQLYPHPGKDDPGKSAS
jgi:hypothetical protein